MLTFDSKSALRASVASYWQSQSACSQSQLQFRSFNQHRQYFIRLTYCTCPSASLHTPATQVDRCRVSSCVWCTEDGISRVQLPRRFIILTAPSSVKGQTSTPTLILLYNSPVPQTHDDLQRNSDMSPENIYICRANGYDSNKESDQFGPRTIGVESLLSAYDASGWRKGR